MNAATTTDSLSRYIQVFDDAFSPALCRQMIDSFHNLQRFQRPNGRGIRPGHDESAWTELNLDPLSDAGFRTMILENMHRHCALYNEALKQAIAIPLTDKISELVIKRYQPTGDEGFQLHFDSIGEKANRYLVFLWYLNDVTEGGGTEFPELGVTIQAKAGRLVMFPPYWMYQHLGQAPVSNDKYILSTYFLF
ncbi:MAG: 2OG-Fe(II) oxygenase [Arenimonas sp.]